MPVFLGVGAIDLGHEVTDEGLLVERREIGAQEVVASAEETVMVDLEEDTRAMLELSRHVCRVRKNSAPLIAVTVTIKNTEWISISRRAFTKSNRDRWVKVGGKSAPHVRLSRFLKAPRSFSF